VLEICLDTSGRLPPLVCVRHARRPILFVAWDREPDAQKVEYMDADGSSSGLGRQFPTLAVRRRNSGASIACLLPALAVQTGES